MKIAIIDYGVGNLHSVGKALEKVGAQVYISSEPSTILAADKVVLPGVGAFGDCAENIRKYELTDTVAQVLNSGTPLLGICVGMQLLFETSEESPGIAGLGFLRGQVKKLVAPGLKIPHIGWNNLQVRENASMLSGSQNEYVYFVHSYHCVPEDAGTITATCDYGSTLVASIAYRNVQAVQFHPEKSSAVGLRILHNFVNGVK